MAPRYARLQSACAVVLALSAMPAMADDFDAFRSLDAKAHQLQDAHDDAGARSAYLDAISALDALGRSQDKEVSAIEAKAYFDLATLDEKLGRDKDAEAEYAKAITYSIPLGAGRGAVVIDGSLKRQQVLYLRDGDYQSAANAAQHELGLFALLRGRDAPLTPNSAYEQLPPTLVLAKFNVHFGELKAGKAFYDRAWVLAETAPVTPPETLQQLYEGSVAVYSRLNLAKEADEAKQRFERIKQKGETQRVVAVQPRTRAMPEEPFALVESPDIKAGFKDGALQLCKPDYPREAFELKQQGTVKLRFRIAKSGAFVRVDIVESSGIKQLDRAAQNALSRCQFTPAMYQGKPVDSEFDAVWVWKLD
ncbi:MAG: energy transducer TonB [Burkholderiaceae bacterium]|nr:energy transducer TonB [Burkholderiaceae bacterium]